MQYWRISSSDKKISNYVLFSEFSNPFFFQKKTTATFFSICSLFFITFCIFCNFNIGGFPQVLWFSHRFFFLQLVFFYTHFLVCLSFFSIHALTLQLFVFNEQLQLISLYHIFFFSKIFRNNNLCSF